MKITEVERKRAGFQMQLKLNGEKMYAVNSFELIVAVKIEACKMM